MQPPSEGQARFVSFITLLFIKSGLILGLIYKFADQSSLINMNKVGFYIKYQVINIKAPVLY